MYVVSLYSNVFSSPDNIPTTHTLSREYVSRSLCVERMHWCVYECIGNLHTPIFS